jgi:hypothetical protein
MQNRNNLHYKNNIFAWVEQLMLSFVMVWRCTMQWTTLNVKFVAAIAGLTEHESGKKHSENRPDSNSKS